jgi:hypothetical protein
MDQEGGPRLSLSLLLSGQLSSLSSLFLPEKLGNSPRPLLCSSVKVKQQDGARQITRTLGMHRFLKPGPQVI